MGSDAEWYERHRAELIKQYEGEYLAIEGHKVIDHDRDFGALAERVFAQGGTRPVFMPKCLPGERVVRVPSLKVARG